MSSFIDDEVRNTKEVLLLIAFDRDQTRRFLNAVIKEKNVIANYGNGTFLGYAEEVIIVQGDWPEKLTVGVIKFDNYAKAKQWFVSDSIFKQQDCLDNVEMFLIPLNESYPTNQDFNVIILQNMHINFMETFKNEIHQQENESIRKFGGFPSLACTGRVVRWRGRSVTDFMTISLWPNADSFHAWFTSDENKQVQEAHASANGADVLLFNLLKRV